MISGCVEKFGKSFLQHRPYENNERMCKAVHAFKREYLPYKIFANNIFIDYPSFRLKFEEELKEVDGDIEQERKAKVSAWYVVTYKEEYRNKEKREKAKSLLGFPWIMAKLLGDIKKSKVEARQRII